MAATTDKPPMMKSKQMQEVAITSSPPAIYVDKVLNMLLNPQSELAITMNLSS